MRVFVTLHVVSTKSLNSPLDISVQHEISEWFNLNESASEWFKLYFKNINHYSI